MAVVVAGQHQRRPRPRPTSNGTSPAISTNSTRTTRRRPACGRTARRSGCSKTLRPAPINVFAYDLATGARQESVEFTLDSRNRFAHGVWSNGIIFWVADSGQDKLFAYLAESGERVSDRDIDLHEDNRDPRGIWSNGETIYVLDSIKDELFAYNLESGELVARYALDKLNRSPRGIWSDGVTIWVSDDGAKRLFAYRIEGDELKRYLSEEFGFQSLLKAGNGAARGIWSDGAVVYVADDVDERLYTYNIPDSIDARLASLHLTNAILDEFSANRLTYSAVTVPGKVSSTVSAVAEQEAATLAIAPADSNAEQDGHQVPLVDETQILVTVTSEDGSRKRDYSVQVSKPPCLEGAGSERLSRVTYVGGSVDELEACARDNGVSALFHYDERGWVAFFLDAPEFLNQPFRARFSNGLSASEQLIVNREPPAAVASSGAQSN